MKWLREGAGVAGLLAAVMLVVVEWRRLPPVIPTHFGMNGAPNGYGTRAELWVMIGIDLLVYLLMTVCTRYPRYFHLPVTPEDPQRPGFEADAVALLEWLRMFVAWLFVYVLWVMIRSALGDGNGLSGWFAVVTIVVSCGWVALWERMRGRRAAGR
jgi:uncharacterized membrane protein